MRELTRHLRPGRSRRYARSQSSKGQGQGKLSEMVMISERPPEVEDRAVPGHWEGDLLIGTPARTRSRPWSSARPATASSSRCPRGAAPRRSARRSSRASRPCRPSFAARSPGIRARRCREHRRFSVESGVEVYFCDPRSPWQRGSNENTNGLLRQYFPKGQSLAGIAQERLDEVAEQAQRPPAQDARLPNPGREARRADRRPRQPAPSADLASAYGLRSTALEPDGRMRNVRGGALTG